MSHQPRVDRDAYARLRKLANDRKDVMVSIRINRLHDATGRGVDSERTKQLNDELKRIDAEWRDEEMCVTDAEWEELKYRLRRKASSFCHSFLCCFSRRG